MVRRPNDPDPRVLALYMPDPNYPVPAVGSVEWVVPPDLPTADDYYIEVMYGLCRTFRTASPRFAIVGPPTVTITSPQAVRGGRQAKPQDHPLDEHWIRLGR